MEVDQLSVDNRWDQINKSHISSHCIKSSAMCATCRLYTWFNIISPPWCLTKAPTVYISAQPHLKLALTTKLHTLLSRTLQLASHCNQLTINTHISQSLWRSWESGQRNSKHSSRGMFTHGLILNSKRQWGNSWENAESSILGVYCKFTSLG